jgi:hypothetical protein
MVIGRGEKMTFEDRNYISYHAYGCTYNAKTFAFKWSIAR